MNGMALQQFKQTKSSGQDITASGPAAVFAVQQSNDAANAYGIEWQSKLAKVPEEMASQRINTCCITWGHVGCWLRPLFTMTINRVTKLGR